MCRRLSAAFRLPCPGLRCIACTYVVAFLTSPSPLHQREHPYLGYLPYSTYRTEHGTAEPSCGVKTPIRLVFRFGLQQSPGARYSCCRSQSLNFARPLHRTTNITASLAITTTYCHLYRCTASNLSL